MSRHPSHRDAPPEVPSGILVFGCGYLGSRVAQRGGLLGQKVYATTRREAKAAELAGVGIEPVIADWTDPSTLRDLPQAGRVLVAVSYDPGGGHSRHASLVDGLRRLLRVVSPHSHICYISTTGVYGQSDGSWVDEDSPACPSREGGKAHLEAEALFRQLRPRSAWTVLRLAGIYGPGRVPRAADVVAGRPIAAPEDGYLNLIHVEDAASAVFAAWSQSTHRLYLVSDDCPVQRGEFYREIARRCDAPMPSFVEPGPGAAARIRSAANRRIRNDRMKRHLIGQLRFPSYREGLASIL